MNALYKQDKELWTPSQKFQNILYSYKVVAGIQISHIKKKQAKKSLPPQIFLKKSMHTYNNDIRLAESNTGYTL